MDFSDVEYITLISLYKSRPILWDPCNSMYKMAKKKKMIFGKKFQMRWEDINQTRKKMYSLLASYRREGQREGNSGYSGAGTNEIYHSKWFAFAEMQFLNDKFKPRTTIT
ncbi:unnamed protein product [Macrosiphum euphorbiae]|uniref:MADF domain-containing protein n=1 Tax=Macrosiphum euphorbiae TaxID=13131 RepID=A0AAV0X6F3_9HEMI|nr:unnamed protein product [Macrosiphum euphorbiae]